MIGDWDLDGISDLFILAKIDHSKKSALHVLSGKSKFQKFIFSSPINLEETQENWDFTLAFWDCDFKPDLVAINKQGKSTTEIHVLSGASKFKEYIYQSDTALEKTDANWAFQLAYWDDDFMPDLVGIKKQGASGKTEIHVLAHRGNYKKFIFQSAVNLDQTDKDTDFIIDYWDKDNKPDLIAVSKKGQKGTELHVLSGASNFQKFIAHLPTKLHKTDENWDFCFSYWDK
jgi:hypothetical protein